VAVVVLVVLEAVELGGREVVVMGAVVLAQQPLHRMELLIQAVAVAAVM
jgi:hypothetical protein